MLLGIDGQHFVLPDMNILDCWPKKMLLTLVGGKLLPF